MRQRSQAHCHVLVAETAKAAAHELYDTLMHDNRMFEMWKAQHPGAPPRTLERLFVAKHWGKCLEVARATLAHMLTTPIDEVLKAQIHEALVLDNTLMRGRRQ